MADDIALTSSRFELDEELVRKTVAKDANADEFKMFMHLCRVYNLDPFKKEIWFMKFDGKPTIITSRDGYLKLASSHPMFDGMEADVVYKGDTLKKLDNSAFHITYGENHMDFNKSFIQGAFCNVFRKDYRSAISIFVPFRDYNKGSGMWLKYPNAMIIKVAESMALKRAFAFNGLVTKEEVGNGEPSAPHSTEVFEAQVVEEEPITVEEVDNLRMQLGGDVGREKKLCEYYKCDDLTQLSKNQYNIALRHLQKRAQ